MFTSLFLNYIESSLFVSHPHSSNKMSSGTNGNYTNGNTHNHHNDTPSTTALLNSPDRLCKIDLLREKNIGKYLPLPQLVAVGDQSSGKSSLLESLTGIPFPRGQELCTRYATQITHRREEHSYINIGIIPGPHATAADKEYLEGYSRQVQSTTQLHAEFASILDEVRHLSLSLSSLRHPFQRMRETINRYSQI